MNNAMTMTVETALLIAGEVVKAPKVKAVNEILAPYGHELGSNGSGGFIAFRIKGSKVAFEAANMADEILTLFGYL